MKLPPKNDDPKELLNDLPRGRSESFLGSASKAFFESPANVLATESLRFDAENLGAKQFLGVVGGSVVTGPRLPDGRVMRWVNGGVPVGVGDDRHSLLLAGSRAGKGRSSLLNILLSLPASTPLLVLDTKGDLARTSALYRESIGQPTRVLDMFGCSGDHTKHLRCGFNALSSLVQSDRVNFVPNAKLIADSLIVSGDFKDKHWDETSKQILATLCAHVATHVNYANVRNLVSVWRLAAELRTPDPNDPHRFLLEHEMLANDAAGGIVRHGARNFYARTGGEFSSVLSNLNKHLDFISIECVQDVLRGESIDLLQVLRQSMALYVPVPAMRMSELSGWMRLLVQLSLAAAEETGTVQGKQAFFMLDEFHALGRMDALEKAIAQIAGFGVKLQIVLQDLNQLRQHYPQSFETFIANAGLMQVFGCADSSTLEYVSKLLGQSQILTRSTNMPTFEQAARHAATGESWSVSSHPLLTAEEVGRYFARDDKKLRQLILRPGYRPMILQRAFYDKHELFREKFFKG